MSASDSTASGPHRGKPRILAWWLLGVALLVFVMVVVGGITRLTESGLSIVRWEPVSGILPPLDAEQWQAEFAAYQASPEYREVNRGMTLAQFQTIYFWEYLHRLLGRVIGLAFALPLLIFWLKRSIPTGYGWRLIALLALGGLQGAIGWWMVASGLVARPDVSHIRLAVHLMTALFILAGLIWTALDLFALERDPRASPARLTIGGLIVAAIVAGQVKLGAFVAGLEAGHAFPTWPKMGSEWFPSGTPWLAPWWSNFSDNPIIVQFVHRWWAVVTVIALIWLARQVRASNRGASIAIHSAFGIQFLLGIATLLTGVNIAVATAHQAFGALVVATMAWGVHILGRRAA